MSKKKTPKFPNKYLVLGVFSLIIGCLFLLWTLGFLPNFDRLWPLPIIFTGLFFLYLVFIQEKREMYVLFGMLLTLGGIFLLLVTTIITAKNLSKMWPGFMLITGISLLPYGIRKKREKYKLAIIIPAMTIIILSCLFFSL
jgi:uncharacterized membrane protein